MARKPPNRVVGVYKHSKDGYRVVWMESGERFEQWAPDEAAAEAKAAELRARLAGLETPKADMGEDPGPLVDLPIDAMWSAKAWRAAERLCAAGDDVPITWLRQGRTLAAALSASGQHLPYPDLDRRLDALDARDHRVREAHTSRQDLLSDVVDHVEPMPGVIAVERRGGHVVHWLDHAGAVHESEPIADADEANQFAASRHLELVGLRDAPADVVSPPNLRDEQPWDAVIREAVKSGNRAAVVVIQIARAASRVVDFDGYMMRLDRLEEQVAVADHRLAQRRAHQAR
ncbi:MAG: hypothetical protein KC503_19410 [Myxococcales bacterium]|nr:hypothetical protein [Myxococcales bacterium]